MFAFEKVWNNILVDLKNHNEAKRFFKIESRIYNIFLETQLNGIYISIEKLDIKLKELKKQKYRNIKILELKYGFLSQKINSISSTNDVKEYSLNENYSNEFDTSFWDKVEIYSNTDHFLEILLNARKATLDYNALIKYTVDDYEKIYPSFSILGTVTGRIIISKPGIQYLRRTSRVIFESKADYQFLYADFDQFEPGIIASISNDVNLLDLYNKGDVYEELSQVLFKTKSKRKLAKVIFLSFIYGMKLDNLKNLILKLSNQESCKKGMKFFSKFNELIIWKEKICENAKRIGYSESYMGNRRYISRSNFLKNDEKRWIPNQQIQGTASYIFKKSLIQLKSECPYLNILIPMHDGILVETPKSLLDEAINKINSIFKDEFQKVCPNIIPSITIDTSFSK